ncbi:MAG TPA: TIGR03118 family protein [Caulobacteraceae bacterium]|nr:TIGR03118 family protein [Caulobacteraceae bacterium]
MHGQKASAVLAGSLAAAIVLGPGAFAHASGFHVTNLVSDGAVPAAVTDPNLVNPWGIASSPTSPFWIADNGTGVSTLYNSVGTPVPLVVTIPGFGGSGTPSGAVFNPTTGFQVSSGGKTGPAAFLFATEDGSIAGWAPTVSSTNAITAVNNNDGGTGAVYKGLTMASIGSSSFLYATNFRAGDVEMYNSSFGLVGAFTDPGVAPGYAPFNVQNLGGDLYVTFALQDAAKHDDVAGPGHGYVDVFSPSGTLLRRLVSLGGEVNSPWGLDIAPKGFGAVGGDLLVGNFGDGTISVFNPVTGTFEGKLLGGNGMPIVEGDLWGLINGNGGSGGSPNDVYFTAGVAHEADGLFGSINFVPEPGAWALMLVGFGWAGAALRRSRASLQRA